VWDELREEVEFELQQLRTLLSYHGDLLRAAQTREPSPTEIAALAAVLHSFYTGIENVFKRVALEVDRHMPAGDTSHRDLLVQIARATDKRPSLISADLMETLGKYLNFRHVFRHVYTYLLQWSKMAGLVGNLQETLEQLQTELEAFFSSAD